MDQQDEKKPPVGGDDEVAKIEVILQRNGRVRLRGTLQGEFNSSTSAMRPREVAGEVAFQLGELSAEWHMRKSRVPAVPVVESAAAYGPVTV